MRDIAAVAAVALTQEGHAGQVYDLTESEPLTSAERAGIFSSVLGYAVQYVAVAGEQFEHVMAQFGMPAWIIAALSELNGFLRTSSRASSAVQQATGRAPITFRQFVEDYHTVFVR